MRTEDRYDSLFLIYGDRYGVNWKLLKAQVKQESGFDPTALSSAGARGLAQFMPPTFAEWAGNLKIENADPFNPEHSIRCQAAYMDWLLKQFDQNVNFALAAYNWGIGNLKKCLAEHGENWRIHLPRETTGYLENIQGYFEEYNEESK